MAATLTLVATTRGTLLPATDTPGSLTPAADGRASLSAYDTYGLLHYGSGTYGDVDLAVLAATAATRGTLS